MTNKHDNSFLRGETNGGIYDESMKPKGDDSWKSTNLGNGLHFFEPDGGNPGANMSLIVNNSQAVLIDNGLEKASQVTYNTVKALAGRSIDFVINTHLHADHLACNSDYVKDGATVIAHDNTMAALLKDEHFNKLGLPNITFNDTSTLYLSGQRVTLKHIPNAHTDSDVIVIFDNMNVIHAADLFFNGIFPFLDVTNGGTLDGFIAAQQQIIDMADDNTIILPGHGPIGCKADLEKSVKLIKDIRDVMLPYVEKGISLNEVVAENPLEKFKEYAWFHISTERMTQIAYFLVSNN
ncbi:MBL fold metallo-hydrolase [Vibrio sp. Isolate22]|uniref:MBL fold metallo-hydrolase n=1 Tax=Vibrio sp. Isolate22 TaxID=2908532 RepID=UPI001EFE758F|nr:MBL fold metallo-hydrolase [Vibrio sp. Isolate22]MCG9691790.1 MBL fold metallo-hydrolase [Vibrio sp. Isolate22]